MLLGRDDVNPNKRVEWSRTPLDWAAGEDTSEW